MQVVCIESIDISKWLIFKQQEDVMVKWSTRKYDLMLAQRLIDKYIDIYDGDTLELFEYIQDNKIKVTCNFPEWTVELMDIYVKQYGEKVGLEVTNKVISTCLLGDDLLH